MLSTLKGQVEFSTGKKIVFDHTFSKGLTAITGPNESGKSVRLEMIRYALFGTKALRSTAASYKSIDVTMEYKIGEVTYKVVRVKNETKLYKEGNVSATGATPVNAAIIKSLGYNMEVFDVANACLQDDITAMTNKTPAERKRMIDKTLGLDALDTLIKETAEKLSAAKTKSSVIDGQLKNIVVSKPQKPAGYESSESLENQMKTLMSQQQLRANAIARLNAAKCELPVDTYAGFIPDGSMQWLLERQAESRAALITFTELQQKIKNTEEAKSRALSKEQVENYEKYITNNIAGQWDEYNQYMILKSQGDDALYTEQEIDLLLLGLTYSDTIEAIETLKKSDNIMCPHCKELFTLAQDHIDTLENTLVPSCRAGYEFWIQNCKPTASTINTQSVRLKAKRSVEAKGTMLQPSIDYIGTTTFVQSLLDLNKVYQERIKDLDLWIKQRDEAQDKIIPNIDKQIADSKKWNDFNDKLMKAEDDYRTYTQLQKTLQPQIDAYGNLDEQVTDLFALISVCKDYEMSFNNYQTMSRIEGELLLGKLEAETEITKQTDIKNALSELKPKVKSYLVPSLSAVASNFLSKMTNNVRNRIDISEEFDITVDGQAVETLSGSGKSVANIAVRLALGTVLTNKIFSVFMADEIDAAMDADRAEFTANCLKELATVFSQIILISHKKPHADNYIQL